MIQYGPRLISKPSTSPQQGGRGYANYFSHSFLIFSTRNELTYNKNYYITISVFLDLLRESAAYVRRHFLAGPLKLSFAATWRDAVHGPFLLSPF